jgi:hypothetical protein
VVTSHLTALLAHHDDRIAVISGDLHDRDAILGAAGLRAVIDLSRPVCVVMGMILHFETAGAAAGLVKRYMSAVPPGSYLIATIASGKGALAGTFYQTYNASGFATMYNHTSADFASFFDDLEIIPPGLGDARQIRPGWSEFLPAPKRPDRVLAGIARVRKADGSHDCAADAGVSLGIAGSGPMPPSARGSSPVPDRPGNGGGTARQPAATEQDEAERPDEARRS